MAVSEDFNKHGIDQNKFKAKNFSDQNCIALQDVLEVFNFPINEEQAWAICYQSLKFLLHTNVYCRVSEFSQILLYKNGEVAIELQKDTEISETVSEKEAIFSLGMILFNALDYGLPEEEEISLCPELQRVISYMTNLCSDDSSNEGLKNDLSNPETGYQDKRITNEILHMCIDNLRLTNKDKVDIYYKDIICCLVLEVIEISNCLNKEFIQLNITESGDMMNDTKILDSNFESVDLADGRIWRAIQVRFWGQVIDELEKSTSSSMKNNDYLSCTTQLSRMMNKCQLGDRKNLLDDIRQRRYQLKNVPPSAMPLEKDTFQTILDFVKSKPQLKKASDRILPPLRKEYNLHDLLMESIKNPPKPLRPAGRHRISDQNILWLDLDTHTTDDYLKKEKRLTTIKDMRKVIPVDFDLKLDEDEDDDDGDNSNTQSERSTDKNNECLKRLISDVDKFKDTTARQNNLWEFNKDLQLTKHEYHKFCDSQLESYDLATQCVSRRVSARKHRIEIKKVNKNNKDDPGDKLQGDFSNERIKLNSEFSAKKKPVPKPRNSMDKNKISSSGEITHEKAVHHRLNEMLLEERLSLTLEEIVHIRCVLTKAELESLPVEGCVKEDVEKRRICFLCLKTRFGILGPWGQRCRLCERTVCVKCYSKMKIPTDHFAQVPVLLLSPGLILSPSSVLSESDIIKNSWSKYNRSYDSAPTSPATKRHTPETSDNIKVIEESKRPNVSNMKNVHYDTTSIGFNRDKSACLKVSKSPMKSSITNTLASKYRKNADQELSTDQLRGISMVVCHDCRLMVVQIIKSSRSTRANIRNNVISRLTLNLSPAYT